MSKNHIYTLKGERLVYQKLGWRYPKTSENTGAARSFKAFVKQLRSTEPEKAVEYLNKGQAMSRVLKLHPCLKKGKIRVFDPNTNPDSKQTILRIQCQGTEFKTPAAFHPELGWLFSFPEYNTTGLKPIK